MHTSLCMGICVCVCICVSGDFHVCMYVYIMCVYICRIYPEKHTYVNKNKKNQFGQGGSPPEQTPKQHVSGYVPDTGRGRQVL